MPISLITRLLSNTPDPREAVRPLWHRVVAIARLERWYAECRVADTIDGRFDMVTAILAVVMLRMERDAELTGPSARLTEWFVEDMDAQLRQGGVGDIGLGKHMGRLMSTLGGRIGAYRDGLAGGAEALEDAVRRNVSLAEGGDPACVASGLRSLYDTLLERDAAAVLAGDV